MKKRLFKHFLLFITLFVGKISFTMEKPDTAPAISNSTTSDEEVSFNELEKVILENEAIHEAQTEEEKSLIGNLALELIIEGNPTSALGTWIPESLFNQKYLYSSNINDCLTQFKKAVDDNNQCIAYLKNFENKISFLKLCKNSFVGGSGILSLYLYGTPIIKSAIDNLQANLSLGSKENLLPLSITVLLSGIIVGLSGYAIHQSFDGINESIKRLCYINSKNYYTDLKDLANHITIEDTTTINAQALQERIATAWSTQTNNHRVDYN